MGRPPTPIVLYFPNLKACILYIRTNIGRYELRNLPTSFPTWSSVVKQFPNYIKKIVGGKTKVPYSILREACILLGCQMDFPWYFMPSNQWRPELRQYTAHPQLDKPIVDFQWKAHKEGNPHYPTYS